MPHAKKKLTQPSKLAYAARQKKQFTQSNTYVARQKTITGNAKSKLTYASRQKNQLTQPSKLVYAARQKKSINATKQISV